MAIVPRVSSTIGLARTLVELRDSMVDLQRQLGTGRKSETYGGLGAGRDISLAMRGKLSLIGGYGETMQQVGLRVDLMNEVLTRVSGVALEAKSDARQTVLNVESGQQTVGQKNAAERLEEVVALLNENVAGRYLFGGQKTDGQAVGSVQDILEGSPGKEGFRQVAADRLLADLGMGDRGRLDISQAGNSVTVEEDGLHGFGFKLVGVSGPAGVSRTFTPADAADGASASVTFDQQPAVGSAVRLTLKLPDGTTTDVSLVATNDRPAKPGEFTVGADTAETAANFSAALTKGVTYAAGTSLKSASALKASTDFFYNSTQDGPIRVAGYAGATDDDLRQATGTVLADEADTEYWYRGATSDDPRSAVSARIDDNILVGYGAQANEEGIARIVGALAVFASEEFGEGYQSPSPAETRFDIDAAQAIADNDLVVNGSSVDLSGLNTADDIAAAIGEAVGGGWDVVNDNGRIIITAADPGAREAMTVEAAGGSVSNVVLTDGANSGGPDVERYAHLMDGLHSRFDTTGKRQTVEMMTAELASVDGSLSRATQRQRTEEALIDDVLDEIEGVREEEVAAQLLHLSTRLQASYEATAMLSQMSLVNYL